MVGPSNSEDLITSLDLSNPLHLQNSDFSSNTIISVKLTGTENYRAWAAAMKLAINTKNKIEFIEGTCIKSAYANSAPRLIGLNDMFQPIKSSLLSRETLLDVKDAFAIVSGFVSKSNNWTNKGNKKVDNKKYENTVNTVNNRGSNPILLCKNYWKVGHTVVMCFNLIGYPASYNKNHGP
ncbi:ribonuclease H-like domain-containing protein, partial [Tanacetum coccineum]